MHNVVDFIVVLQTERLPDVKYPSVYYLLCTIAASLSQYIYMIAKSKFFSLPDSRTISIAVLFLFTYVLLSFPETHVLRGRRLGRERHRPSRHNGVRTSPQERSDAIESDVRRSSASPSLTSNVDSQSRFKR
jgi:hypothetical protein